MPFRCFENIYGSCRPEQVLDSACLVVYTLFKWNIRTLNYITSKVDAEQKHFGLERSYFVSLKNEFLLGGGLPEIFDIFKSINENEPPLNVIVLITILKLSNLFW